MVNAANVTNVRKQQRNSGSRSVKTAANTNRALSGGNVTQFPSKEDANPFYTTQDEAFNNQYNTWQNNQTDAQRNINRVNRTYTNDNYTPVSPTNIPSVKRVKRKKKASLASKAWARGRLSAVNVWVIGWAMFWYLWFQLPMAAVSTAGLGITYYIYDYISKIPFGQEAIELAGQFVFLAETSAGKVISLITDKTFGFAFDPISLFILPFILIFILGILQLLLTWFVYSCMGIKTLTGQAGGIKSTMFLFVGVGYALPILNMFPLILLWIIVVWLYPK